MVGSRHLGRIVDIRGSKAVARKTVCGNLHEKRICSKRRWYSDAVIEEITYIEKTMNLTDALQRLLKTPWNRDTSSGSFARPLA